MSAISVKIRAYVADLSVSNHYGEWGALRPDQRRQIRELCDVCDAFEKTADKFLKENERLTAELDKYEEFQTTLNEFWDMLLKLKIAKRKEKPTLEEFAEAIQEIESEAYKECIEKLKEKTKGLIGQNFLDDFLKELVGEDK